VITGSAAVLGGFTRTIPRRSLTDTHSSAATPAGLFEGSAEKEATEDARSRTAKEAYARRFITASIGWLISGVGYRQSVLDESEWQFLGASPQGHELLAFSPKDQAQRVRVA
jgi:hypothetical protein